MSIVTKLPAVGLFAGEMARSREIAKGPELFTRSLVSDGGDSGEFRILRRWNSHTPSVVDVVGGGYFLYWQARGTVIDPGYGFVRLLQERTECGFGDINLVVTTHDHMDHCQDFAAIIALLRQYNKWGMDRQRLESPHTLDLIMSHGVAAQFASILDHSENMPFLRYGKILPPSPIKRVQKPPNVALVREKLAVDSWKSPQKELCRFYDRTIEDDYLFRLHALSTMHSELLGDKTGMGLRFELLEKQGGGCAMKCVIVISGDTGADPASQLAKPADFARAYVSDCDMNLLVLHVGNMEGVDAQSGSLKREAEHLGLHGTVEILLEMVKQCQLPQRLPRAVVLTEWGYEFGRAELYGRSRFTELVVETLRANGCDRFHAAVKGAKPINTSIPIIPGDVELRFRLPDLAVWCKTASGFDWCAPATVRAEEYRPDIVYCGGNA